MSSCVAASEAIAPAKPAWRAVYSLGLGVFGLITAEFLPASLLTPMAASLGVTEGMAGQAVTATALVALVTGLLITPATKSIDRRWVLMFFSVLQIISSLLVAFAPTLHVLLMGRLLLGVPSDGQREASVEWTLSDAAGQPLGQVVHHGAVSKPATDAEWRQLKREALAALAAQGGRAVPASPGVPQ